MATKKNLKKGNSNKKASKKSDRGLDYKDVMVRVMANGHDFVMKLLKEDQISLAIVLRAVEEMKTFSADKAQLLEQAVKAFKPTIGRLGRAGPKVGEERDYMVQSYGDQGLFIRLPVENLEGIKKGSMLRVKFNADKFEVAPVAKAQRATA